MEIITILTLVCFTFIVCYLYLSFVCVCVLTLLYNLVHTFAEGQLDFFIISATSLLYKALRSVTATHAKVLSLENCAEAGGMLPRAEDLDALQRIVAGFAAGLPPGAAAFLRRIRS